MLVRTTAPSPGLEKEIVGGAVSTVTETGVDAPGFPARSERVAVSELTPSESGLCSKQVAVEALGTHCVAIGIPLSVQASVEGSTPEPASE